MPRDLRIVASGLLSGLLIGTLGLVAFVAVVFWDGRARLEDSNAKHPYWTAVWSALTDDHVLPYWAALAGAAGVNGGIGAWVGRSGNRRRRCAASPAPSALQPTVVAQSWAQRARRAPSRSSSG